MSSPAQLCPHQGKTGWRSWSVPGGEVEKPKRSKHWPEVNRNEPGRERTSDSGPEEASRLAVKTMGTSGDPQRPTREPLRCALMWGDRQKHDPKQSRGEEGQEQQGAGAWSGPRGEGRTCLGSEAGGLPCFSAALDPSPTPDPQLQFPAPPEIHPPEP